MKKVSYWAKASPIKARYLLVFLYLVTILNAVMLGVLFFIFDMQIPNYMTVVSLLLFGFSFVTYPVSQNDKYWNHVFYIKRKSADFILVFSSFLMLSFSVSGYLDNNITYDAELTMVESPPIATFVVYGVGDGKQNKNLNKAPRTKQKRKLRKQKRKQMWKTLKEGRKQLKEEDLDGLKVFLIMLIILIGVGLGYLMAVLSCNVACTSGLGMGVLVGVLGYGFIIGGLIVLCRKIVNWKRKRKKRRGDSENIEVK